MSSLAAARGCATLTGARSSWQRQSELTDAARRLSRGVALKDAVFASGYRALRSADIHVRAQSDAEVVGIVRERFCPLLMDSELRDIGAYQRADETWIVLAQPRNTPQSNDGAAVSQRVLALINQARAHGRRCGHEVFGAAPPLTLSPVLAEAATEHARDMARHAYMSHTGHDGSTREQRVTETGYRWRLVGENVAMGSPNADAVVQGWLATPAIARIS